jgi:hypothetical protein
MTKIVARCGAAALALLGVLGLGLLGWSATQPSPPSSPVAQPARERADGGLLTEFPPVPTAGLTDGQQRLLAALRREYDARPPSVKYSAGVPEPWCADFISWVMRDAGMRLANPHSGSWRIPGVLTLASY